MGYGSEYMHAYHDHKEMVQYFLLTEGLTEWHEIHSASSTGKQTRFYLMIHADLLQEIPV
jgi:hypothetical protein